MYFAYVLDQRISYNADLKIDPPNTAVFSMKHMAGNRTIPLSAIAFHSAVQLGLLLRQCSLIFQHLVLMNFLPHITAPHIGSRPPTACIHGRRTINTMSFIGPVMKLVPESLRDVTASSLTCSTSSGAI